MLRLTLFVSAFLLFWCQPMVAKMVLPLLGGSASVWTTCVLFFQVVLLGGYVYAHGLSRIADIRKQLTIHGILLVSAVGFIPFAFPGEWGPVSVNRPVAWLLLRLTISVGLPLFAISATAPLVQNWLGRTNLDVRYDPYFLYSASNAGSLLSLVVYPLLVEPRFGLLGQVRTWAAGYLVLLMLMAATVTMIRRHSSSEIPATPLAHPGWRQRTFWMAAALVPSALMLAVTTHISVNLASVPLLWIVPLGIYLLTFIMAFAQRQVISARWLAVISPVVFVTLLLLVPDAAPLGPKLNGLLMAAHVAALFFGALLCHTALAESRPDSQHLTEFYFWVALGGALGGLFAALAAPALFTTILEYPLLVAALPFFRRKEKGQNGLTAWDWTSPALIGLLFLAVWATGTTSVVPDAAFFLVLLAFRKRHFRFAVTFAILMIGYSLTLPAYVERGRRVAVVRNFFGVKKVLADDEQKLLKLVHGEILHGAESMEPGKEGIPLSYYHPTGPVGDVMATIGDRPGQTIGVVGLGTGSIAAYGGANRQIIFYDVDPQVESIARQYFSYLRRCGTNCTVITGDGRLSIERAPDRTFDLIMLDAFSSDSVPAHLVSREAMQIYQRKLKLNGLLLFHISNRYLNVGKLVAGVTLDAGLVTYIRSDRTSSPVVGRSGSDYAVSARHVSDLGILPIKGTWQRAAPDTAVRPWTDDYSNVLSLLRWDD